MLDNTQLKNMIFCVVRVHLPRQTWMLSKKLKIHPGDLSSGYWISSDWHFNRSLSVMSTFNRWSNEILKKKKTIQRTVTVKIVTYVYMHNNYTTNIKNKIMFAYRTGTFSALDENLTAALDGEKCCVPTSFTSGLHCTCLSIFSEWCDRFFSVICSSIFLTGRFWMKKYHQQSRTHGGDIGQWLPSRKPEGKIIYSGI